MKNKFQVLLNAHESSAEILIYGTIGQGCFDGGVAAREVAESLNLLKNVPTIVVRINSPGGDLFDGLAIYNSLLKHPSTIRVEIEGIALSAASLIAMSGDTIVMAESSLFMIHNPATFAFGDAGEIRKTADVLDKAKETLVKAYASKSGLSEKVISDAMNEETWYTASEGKAAGFVSEVSKAASVSARFDLANYKFKNVPSSYKGATENKTQEKDDFLKEAVLPNEAIEPKDDFNLNDILFKEVELATLEV